MKLTKITSIIALTCITLAFTAGNLLAESIPHQDGGTFVYLTIKSDDSMKGESSGLRSIVIDRGRSDDVLISAIDSNNDLKWNEGSAKKEATKRPYSDAKSSIKDLMRDERFGRPGDYFRVTITPSSGQPITTEPIQIGESSSIDKNISKTYALKAEWNNDGWHFIITVYGKSDFPVLNL